MPTRFEIYCDKALECERLAAKARSIDVKNQLIGIARQWREMAEWHEKNLRLISAPLDNPRQQLS